MRKQHLLKKRRRRTSGFQRDHIPLAEGERGRQSLPKKAVKRAKLRLTDGSVQVTIKPYIRKNGRMISAHTQIKENKRIAGAHIVRPHFFSSVKPRETNADQPNSVALLAVLLFREGSALPRTPTCQRDGDPFGNPVCAFGAFLFAYIITTKQILFPS